MPGKAAGSPEHPSTSQRKETSREQRRRMVPWVSAAGLSSKPIRGTGENCCHLLNGNYFLSLISHISSMYMCCVKKTQPTNQKPLHLLLIYFTKCVLILESTYRHQATIDDEVVSMEILDTAGQVRGYTYYYPIFWLR